MTVSTLDRPVRRMQHLRACVAFLAALVVLKYVALLAQYDWDVSRSPFMLLVVVAIPVGIILGLSRRRPRAAAGVALPLLLLFAVAVVLAVVRDGLVRESWADYPSAYGGLVLAVWGAITAVQILRPR